MSTKYTHAHIPATSTSCIQYTNRRNSPHADNLNLIQYISKMGWLRSVGSIKLQVSFAEYCLLYMAFFAKEAYNLIDPKPPHSTPPCLSWCIHCRNTDCIRLFSYVWRRACFPSELARCIHRKRHLSHSTHTCHTRGGVHRVRLWAFFCSHTYWYLTDFLKFILWCSTHTTFLLGKTTALTSMNIHTSVAPANHAMIQSWFWECLLQCGGPWTTPCSRMLLLLWS